MREFDVAVLAAIAYHQPVTREGLKDIFAREISRDLIGRLHARELIATGPRSPRRGAPYTFVTTEAFLVAFDLQSLRDLPGSRAARGRGDDRSLGSVRRRGGFMILFLGSGVSLASGLPSVLDITDQLLEGAYCSDPSGNEFFCAAGEKGDRTVQTLHREQRLLRMLATIDKHYLDTAAPYVSGSSFKRSGSIYRSVTTYEDLFQMCMQIKQNGLGLTEDAMTGAFVDKIEREAGDLLDGDCLEECLISLYHLSSRAAAFIEWLVAQKLETNAIAGLDLVVELARSPSIERLDIITLNHDTLVEQLLQENDIPFADGFGAADGDLRFFDDQVYDTTTTKVRILKPHGSVNWYRVRGVSYPAVFCGTRLDDCRLASGERKYIDIQTPAFLSGPGKILTYNRGIFSEIFYRMHQTFRQHNSLVMSGYGWGDTALNFRIVNWLGYTDQNAMMLLHRNSEELIDRSMQLAEVYRAYVEKGRIKLMDRWLSETDIFDVTSFIERNGDTNHGDD